MRKMTEWQYISCVTYKQQNKCNQCPNMVDRENNLCLSNSTYIDGTWVPDDQVKGMNLND